jgi:hypothetical protein
MPLELCRSRRDPHIRGQGEGEARASGGSVDGCYDWCRQLPQRERCPCPLLLPAQKPRFQGSADMLATAVRTVFAQLDAEHVCVQLDVFASIFGRQVGKIETMLRSGGKT